MATTYQVSEEQMARIDAAWAICAHPSSRKATGAWAKTFRQCVAEVLGFEPADTFSLCIAPSLP